MEPHLPEWPEVAESEERIGQRGDGVRGLVAFERQGLCFISSLNNVEVWFSGTAPYLGTESGIPAGNDRRARSSVHRGETTQTEVQVGDVKVVPSSHEIRPIASRARGNVIA